MARAGVNQPNDVIVAQGQHVVAFDADRGGGKGTLLDQLHLPPIVGIVLKLIERDLATGDSV